MRYKTPISYVYKNMVVSSSTEYIFSPMKRFSFVYRIEGDPYELMPSKSKRVVIDKLTSLIIDLNSTTKIFGVPVIQDISQNFSKEQEKVINRYKRHNETFPLEQMMIDYDAVIEEYAIQEMQLEGQSKAVTYLLIQSPFKNIDVDTFKQMKETIFSEPLNTLQRFFDGRTRFTDSQLQLMEDLSNKFVNETRAKGIKIYPISSQEVVNVIGSSRTRGLPAFEQYRHDFILKKKGEIYEPYTHDLEPLFDARFTFNIPKTLVVETEHGKSYQAFINVYQIPRTSAPGGEWLHMVKDFSFPIEWCMTIQPQDKDSSKSAVSTKKMRIDSEKGNAQKANMEIPKELQQSERALNHLSNSIEKENQGFRQVSTTFCLFADSHEELERRVILFMNYFKDRKFKMSRADNRIDLMNAYREMLLTSDHHVKAFHILMPSVNVASSVFASSTPIGDDSGRYIGTTGRTKERVFLNQSNAVFENKSGNMGVVADLGGGKSFYVNLLAYLGVTHGEQRIQIDPKGGRSERFLEYLPELHPYLNIITVENSDHFRGVFDPFNIYPDDYVELTTSGHSIKGYDRACSLATDIIYDSVKSMDDEKEIILHASLKAMESSKQKSMTELVNTMRTLYEGEEGYESRHMYAKTFADLIDTLNGGLSKLYFGKGTQKEKDNALDLTKPWTVIETQNIPYPDEGKLRSEYTKDDLASSILNSLILNTIRAHAYKKRIASLGIDIDEAHIYKQSRVGTATLSQMAKMSRQLNFYMNFLIHSLDDLPKEVLNTLSYMTYFRSGNIEEIPRRLNFIGLESSESNINIMKSLRTGECILKDQNENIARVEIDAVLPRLIEAFSSTPES